MSIDTETLSKIEEALEYKRSKNPFNIEFNRLMNEVYPYEKLYDIFKFGQLNMLVFFKNDVYKYMGKDGQDCIDSLIEQYLKTDEFKEILNKLIHKETKL